MTMTVDKTVEMCRLSAKTQLIKSVLASTHFSEPKEVLAKFITESNQENTETRILSYGQQNNSRRGNKNFRNFRGNRTQFNNQYQNNNRGNDFNYQNNNSNNFRGRRGRGRGNYNGN